MMKWLEKLNLQPHERRWVLIGVVILFVVLNYVLVRPYFDDWKQVQTSIEKMEADRTRYLREIGKKSGYEKDLAKLQAEGGNVLQAEQANLLQSSVQAKAAESGINLGSTTGSKSAGGRGSHTNAFFDEQQMTFDLTGTEAELVNFLHSLGAGDLPIRVREINQLRLDQTKTKLTTRLTAVASFQKKPAAAPAATNSAKRSPSPVVQSKSPAPTNNVAARTKK